MSGEQPWRTIPPTTPAVWRAEFRRVGSPMEATAAECQREAWDHGALLLAMAWMEQRYATDNAIIPASYHNALSLKVPASEDPDRPFGMYAQWADGFTDAYQRITSPTYGDGVYARTRTLRELIEVWAPADDANDVDRYIEVVEERLAAYRALEGGMALPIRTSLIPAGNVNRPGIPLNLGLPLYITIHETANKSVGADAAAHERFTHRGGNDQADPTKMGVSFHMTVDDHEAIQLLPFDEVGWHAGDGCNDRATDLGCYQSIAIETCVNSDGNWRETLANLAELVATIIRTPSRFAGGAAETFSVNRIVQHNQWSGKDCPAIIRRTGKWTAVIENVRALLGDDNGDGYPAPDVPDWLTDPFDGRDHKLGTTTVYACEREWTATATTKVRKYADVNAPEVRAPLVKGDTFKGVGIFVGPPVYRNRWWVLSAFGSRVPMARLSPKLRVEGV